MSIIPNNHYLVTPRHEGYDIALKCPDCGYHCEHLEIGTEYIWPEELRAIIDIDSGRAEMTVFNNVEKYLASLEPPIPNDFDPDLYDPDADPEIEEEEGE